MRSDGVAGLGISGHRYLGAGIAFEDSRGLVALADHLHWVASGCELN